MREVSVEEIVKHIHKRIESLCNGPFSKLKFKRSVKSEVYYIVSGFCQSCKCELFYEVTERDLERYTLMTEDSIVG